MILTVDAGNTNIVLGGFENDKLLFLSRIATQTALTADEYAVKFSEILALYGYRAADIGGAAISSVVTPLTPVFGQAVKRLSDCKTVTVGPGIKTGVNIKIDDPAALGADLVCGAVGAMEKYDPPCVIFDLGTATTISAIDRNRFFLGGSIIPGVKVSLKALSATAAALPDINTELTGDVLIGTNTVDSMKSGSIIGTASMMDGMALRYREAIGTDASVIATGGLAPAIVPFCREKFILDETLLIDGLYVLYKKNA
ncbi:MAG: type III pantothenate kinase [Prevotella sp.]|nr:type III pantothenate kinase [Prevotella sp.]